MQQVEKELIISLQKFSRNLQNEAFKHLTEIGQAPEQIEVLLQEVSEDLSKICKKHTGLDLKNLIQ